MSYEPIPARIALCTLSVGWIVACSGANIQPVPVSRCLPPTSTAREPIVGLASQQPTVTAATRLIAPSRWLVLGPFPDAEADHLAPLGGEAEATITEGTAEKFASESVSVVQLGTDPLGKIDLERALGDKSNRVLYAYAELTSNVAQRAIVQLAVNGSVKVWVNGALVHQRWRSGPSANHSGQEFSTALRAGANRILVKMDTGSAEAAFVFMPFTESDHRLALAEAAEARVPDEELISVDGDGWVRADSRLPDLTWSNPALAQWTLGSSALEYTWYGPDGNPAHDARALGPYTAVVTYHSKSGASVRRSQPLLRVAPGFLQNLDWSQPTLPKPKHLSWNDWRRVESSVAAWAGGLITRSPSGIDSLPIVLGEILSPPRTAAVELGAHASMIRWQQRQLDLKRRLLGLGEPKRVAPALRSTPAPVLRVGSVQQAGIRPQALATVRKMAADWAAADQQPYVLILARHGVVFLHESYGLQDGKPLPVSQRFRPASIGKSFAALLFAQFVEQGLLSPSLLVGEVLVRWPTQGEHAITFRQLFDHTAGLTGYNSYHGLDNPWLEDAFVAHTLPRAKPGLYYLDEGDGSNIAAKAMELIDGRAFPILQRQELFSRLGAHSIDQWDGGWADAATALDVARVAQMLLQKGAYGDWQFFSEDTWSQLLPTRLADLYPNLHDRTREGGIGLEHAWDPEDDVTATASASNQPRKRLHTLGLGSASSSVCRIDYQHDTVLVAARPAASNSRLHEKHLHALVRALEEAIAD